MQAQKRRVAAQIGGSGKLSADHSPDHNDIRLPAAISDLAERITPGQQRYATTCPLTADFFHVDCAVSLPRLYCFFVIEVGGRYVHTRRHHEPGRAVDQTADPQSPDGPRRPRRGLRPGYGARLAGLSSGRPPVLLPGRGSIQVVTGKTGPYRVALAGSVGVVSVQPSLTIAA